MKNNDKSNIHAGHRQRLKEKVRTNGVKVLSTHEVLELLLTYSIPYKDTNVLAHKLLSTFGSFANVLEADKSELLKVNGVGEETALFLSSMPEYFKLFNKSKIENKVFLTSVSDCVKYFRSNNYIQKNEIMFIACIDAKNRLIKTIEIGGNSSVEVEFDVRYVTEKIASVGTSGIVIFHTHPSGSCEPSSDDIISTKRMVAVCSILGIDILDHIILNENEFYSFGIAGVLSQIKTEINKSLNGIMNDSCVRSNLQQNKSNFNYT